MAGEAFGPDHWDRRDFLKMTGAGALVLTMMPFAAEATPEMVVEAMSKVIGDKSFKQGRVNITLPEIAENGASVALRVAVDGPMTADDYVSAIHIFAEANPFSYIGSYYLSPRNGRAEVAMRIRLAETQKIVVVAETSKGEAFLARRAVKVTIGGCGG